jgi:hypothetical protein
VRVGVWWLGVRTVGVAPLDDRAVERHGHMVDKLPDDRTNYQAAQRNWTPNQVVSRGGPPRHYFTKPILV